MQQNNRQHFISDQAPKKKKSVLETGIFTTPKPDPEVLESEYALAVESAVKTLIDLHNEGPTRKDQFDRRQRQILKDYDSLPQDKSYYLQLLKEAFEQGAQEDDDSQNVAIISKESRLIEAYRILEQALN